MDAGRTQLEARWLARVSAPGTSLHALISLFNRCGTVGVCLYSLGEVPETTKPNPIMGKGGRAMLPTPIKVLALYGTWCYGQMTAKRSQFEDFNETVTVP